jgi:putative ABC transport system permease protein
MNSRPHLETLSYLIRMAVDSIVQNRVRAFLTALGIIFGVSSVITMLAIGRGAEQEILEQMKLLGTNNIIIRPVVEQKEEKLADGDAKSGEKKKFSPGLTNLDAEAIRTSIPEIEMLASEVIYETQLVRNGLRRSGKLAGVETDYFTINGLTLAAGAGFLPLHFEQSSPVCVIGDGVRAKFFPGEEPIGQQIKCGSLWLTVVGVLERRDIGGRDLSHLGLRDINMDVYAPVTSVLLRFKNRASLTLRDIRAAANKEENGEKTVNSGSLHQLDRIVVRVAASEMVSPVSALIARFLQRRHNNVVDYEVVVPEMLLQQEQRTRQIFNIVLSSIAGISLLVGGIGIMNIMLASVLERFKEIGVRMAIGARKSDILLQFLTESMVLSLSGGLIGVVLGLVLSVIVRETTGIPTLVTPLSVLISFAVALSVGLVFGIAPARRAASFQPADAARYE